MFCPVPHSTLLSLNKHKTECLSPCQTQESSPEADVELPGGTTWVYTWRFLLPVPTMDGHKEPHLVVFKDVSF